MNCEQAPEVDYKETSASAVTEVELEEPIIQIEGNADVDVDCKGQGLGELQALEQFSCNCTQIECVFPKLNFAFWIIMATY